MSEKRPRPDRRAAQAVQQDQSRKSAPYDAYADHDFEPPRIQLFVVAFRGGTYFDGEWIDTDGLDVREFAPGLKTDSRRRWLASRTVAATDRLVTRIDPGSD